MTSYALALFVAAGMPEGGIGTVAAARPQRFAAATYPLHGMLGEHLYARLHPGGETATETALLVTAVPEQLARTVPPAASCELVTMYFPVPPDGVIPDEATPYPLPFPAWVAPLEALDHGDVVARRAEEAAPQVLRAWLSTTDILEARP